MVISFLYWGHLFVISFFEFGRVTSSPPREVKKKKLCTHMAAESKQGGGEGHCFFLIVI